MGLIFVIGYQHHDAGLLNPVIEELAKRGHVLMTRPDAYSGFLLAHGPRALLLVADFMLFGHAQGLSAVAQARSNGIQSVSIQHGCPMDFNIVGKLSNITTADTYCLWGSYWGQYFDSPRQVVTGSPTMDAIVDYDVDGAIERGREWLGGYQLSERPKALLLTALREYNRCDGFKATHNQERAEYYVEEAKKIGWDGLWIVRPHPSDLKHEGFMEAYGYIVHGLNAVLQMPQDRPLYDVLANCELVMGTSTVIIEALAFGCETVPLLMDYLPDDWRERNEEFFGSWPLDGGAASRIADEVEKCLKT